MMKRKFSTWLMTLLFLVLIGLTIWIVWAVQKVERVKRPDHSASPRLVPGGR
jgi:hypothetical protein